jgi:hypothetical protein
MCAAITDVRFTPNSDRKSEIPQKAMTALHPKADMCGATRHVRFGPKADIRISSKTSNWNSMSIDGAPNEVFPRFNRSFVWYGTDQNLLRS